MKKMLIGLLLVPMLCAEPMPLVCIEIDTGTEIVAMIDSDNKHITITGGFSFSTNWQETDTTIFAIDDDEGILELEFNKYLGTLNLNFFITTMKYKYQCKKAESLLQ